MCVCVFVCEETPEHAFRNTDGCISTQWELMFYFFAAINLSGGFRYNYFRCTFVCSIEREKDVCCDGC